MNTATSAIETALYTFQSNRTLINILVMVLIGVVVFLVSAYVDRERSHGRYMRALLWAGCAAYVYFILFITILGRSALGKPQAKWVPLWSWMDVIGGYRRMYYLQEIFLNILLFIPLGFLLGAILKIKVWQALLFGLALSFLVEVIQYASCRGLFEWDDMIHNAIGCMLGAWFFQIFYSHVGISRENNYNDT